jgi:type III secretory pathway component EscR
MKRFAAYALLFILSFACLTPASAQVTSIQENERRAHKAQRKQEKMLKKANKKQRKAMKKAQKKQRKATKKANRDLERRRAG